MDNQTALIQEELRKKLELARKYLKGADNSLFNKDFRVSTDAAYNAAELVMKVAILLKGKSIPKRHGSIAQLFSLLYIKEGPLEKEMGDLITDGLELRSHARYNENSEITQEHAQHNLDLAKTLIEFLRKELKKA